MDFQEEQYIIDGVIYNITETPQIHQRLRSDPDFAQQYIYGATSQLQSSVETNKNESINEEIQDISNNNTIKDNNTSDNNTNNNNTIEVHEKLHNTSNEEIGGFKWPHEAILLLLEEYNIRKNDFVSGKISQKKVWSLIAGEMMKHGHNVTGAQCLSKFSGLKRTYKAVKDHNNKSGNATRSWTYFSHMDTLLGEKPFMSSVSIVSSTGKRTLSQSECTSSDDSCSSTNEKPKKFRQTSNTDKLIEDLKEDRKLTEEAMERRHKENMQIRERLLHSFEKMVDILSKK